MEPTISINDVVKALVDFTYKNLSADIANDSVYEFASALTGISIDHLERMVEETEELF